MRSLLLLKGATATTCGSNVAASEEQICGALKWHCHDPGAQNIVDLTDTSCHGNQWGTAGCCYAEGGGTSCDREELMADGDDIFNDWYAATGDCSGTASQMFNSPQMCVAKDSIDNVSYCGKLKWYCHDPFAQDILNMSNHVCHGNQWETVGCCYGVDNGASCDRDALLQDATDIADYWYTTKQQCNNNDWDLVDREVGYRFENYSMLIMKLQILKLRTSILIRSYFNNSGKLCKSWLYFQS